MKWMTRFQIGGRRLKESWMDLCAGLSTDVSTVLNISMKVSRNSPTRY